MIRLEKYLELKPISCRFSCCIEIIRRRDGVVMVAVGARRSQVAFYNFSTGELISVVKIKSESDAESHFTRIYRMKVLKDVHRMELVLTEARDTLFCCDYSNINEIKVEKIETTARVYGSNDTVCLYSDFNVAFVTRNDLLVFFDLRKRQILKELVLGTTDRPRYILRRVYSDYECGTHHFKNEKRPLIFCVGSKTYLDSGSVFIVDSQNFEILVIVGSREADITLDYYRKECFLRSCNGRTHGGYKGKVYREVYDEEKEETETEEIILKNERVDIDWIIYCYGKECIIGVKENRVIGDDSLELVVIENKEWNDIQKNLAEVTCTCIKNGGKDIFVFDGDVKPARIYHFVNSMAGKDEEDPFENERIEYLRNMENFENDELELIKIFGEFVLFKSFFVY